ncbi:MAG: DUF881 domain-containing protein [Bacillota bacterium]
MSLHHKDRLLRLIFICAGIVLALDTIAFARRMSLFRLPGEMDDIEMVRRGGYAVASELRRSAREAGVSGDSAVSDALSSLDTALGLAASPADVARALSCEARNVEEAIAAARTGAVGPAGDGEEGTLRERIRALQEEIRALQDELTVIRERAGVAELRGPGMIVHAYDARNGYQSREIVHEKDIKDILNLLFYAGARGAEVGGQRIVAQSSIRCAGPVLLVNQQLVPVNPVVIKAVGDPDALKRALTEVEGRFERDGKRLEIKVQALVTLAAFSKGRT